jgi:UDP-GlcNAc:undecaprenyl-phosphate GlcNAc-1-phosphate transferase
MSNTIITYSILSFLILFIFALASYKLNLVDLPSERKIHLKPTAFTGGLTMSIIYICSIQLFDIHGKDLNLILSIAFLIAILGLIDDKYNLDTGSKLSLQIIPIFYLIVFENMTLTHIGDYRWFKLNLGTFSIPFTLICVLFLINSFNYFDGVDGLLSLVSISVLAIIYFLIDDENTKLFLIITSIPIFIFLCFNFSLFKLPKLFLGDGGSLLLGFIISFLMIYLANQKFVHPILLAWSVQIFVYEFISINLIRLKNKQNIFKAGKDHLHHFFMKQTKSSLLTDFFISSINVILFIIGYMSFRFINPLTSLIFFRIFFYDLFYFKNKISQFEK